MLTIGRLQNEYMIDLADAAVVIRTKDGKVKIRQTHNMTGVGAASGDYGIGGCVDHRERVGHRD